jgi:arylsulfatase A-like enzyme
MSDPGRRPNILFVFSDQHRWCDLGCYGNTAVRSPHLDALAREAVRCQNCISNSPLCVPSRGSLLTGLLPMRHGAIANDLPIREDVASIADALNAAGYHTGYIGKWHLAGVPRDRCIPPGRGRLGFAEWKVCNCNHDYGSAYYYDEDDRRIPIDGYEPVGQTDLAIDFIRRNRERPWALVLSWGPPHDPYLAVPDRYLQAYAGQDLPLRPNVPEAVRATRTRTLTRDEIRKHLGGYYAHITALDEQFGRLIAALRSAGLAEDTIVVYTSDHGDMLGSQGLTNKQLPYEESIRVPLLVSWPGHTFTGVSDECIGLVDLPVSLLALAGVTPPPDTDGADLHALFADPSAQGRDACYIFDLIPCHQAAARGGTEWRGLRTRRHTFARTASDGGFILFDNQEDPFQLRNLVDDPAHAPLKRELSARLDVWIARHDELLPWEALIRKYGFRDAWNRSQAYFRLPLLN